MQNGVFNRLFESFQHKKKKKKESVSDKSGGCLLFLI